jgi:hypothetical protein
MKKGEEEEGWHGTTAYPRRRRLICPWLPTTTSATGTSTCGGGGGIRVLHADDADGTWCGFALS